jgi:hypothetical protein
MAVMTSAPDPLAQILRLYHFGENACLQQRRFHRKHTWCNTSKAESSMVVDSCRRAGNLIVVGRKL